jgi:hypothetical protein
MLFTKFSVDRFSFAIQQNTGVQAVPEIDIWLINGTHEKIVHPAFHGNAALRIQ